MAKRRKLEAPSADDMARLEAEIGAGGAPRAVAPIAQVAADSAAAVNPVGVAERTAQARDTADAARLRTAEAEGRVMLEIPLDEIEPHAIVRDRTVIDEADLIELQTSIQRTGLRLPIEVFAQTGEGARYGLLSGYRRFLAMQRLHELTGQHGTIKAVLREPENMGGPFAAMVEENEVRAQLSQFERGRIAVIAAQQGAFVNVEAAVDGLFPVASKAKRSKIRSFALIFEELGDLLRYPDLLREKDGLRIAAVLRDGQGERLRDLLAQDQPASPEAEATLIDSVLEAVGPVAPKPTRGGRPRKEVEAVGIEGDSGVRVSSSKDGQAWVFRVDGATLDRDMVELLMWKIEGYCSGR